MILATNQPIYLDHAATTAPDPEVIMEMLPLLSAPLANGNPSSIHYYGREARAKVDEARDRVASLIHAHYGEVYFTSSGTEADNLALIGGMTAAPQHRNHLIVSAIEHHAVLHSAHYLQSLGYAVTILQPDPDGLIPLDSIASALTDKTALVSVMHANNEIGTIQPVEEIAQICKAQGVLFHTDAVQTAGILEIDVEASGFDLLTVSSHKFYGPKGAAALYIRTGVKVNPLLHGGAQEREKRAGTENVPALVGFGKSAELAQARKADERTRLTALRDRLWNRLQAGVADIRLNGHPSQRLPGNLNVSVGGVEGATLLMRLDRNGICVSSGSACSSGSIEPSHVLKAIGLPDSLASSGVRFSLGRENTEDEVDTAADIFIEIISKLRH